MSGSHQNPSASGAGTVSITLIGPDETRRTEVATALSVFPGVQLTEFSAYPVDLDDLPPILQQQRGIVIVDLDSDPEYALEVVESLFADSTATVMVYSATADRTLVVRAMRAGAREFFALPLAATEVADALARFSVHAPGERPTKKKAGRLVVFLGTKGGCGVTTLATRFSVVLSQESEKKVLLIDLGQPLGDAALHLGLFAEYSTDNAFRNSARLDVNFLQSLLVKHASGLSVLASPNEVPQGMPPVEAFDKMLAVARQNFDFVVVDAGSRVDLKDTTLFDPASTIYLVTQFGVSELRNSNRMISQFFATRGRRLQIVLNRFAKQGLGFDEEKITKALTRPAQWKVPDDLALTVQLKEAAPAVTQKGSSGWNVLRKMARKTCGLPESDEKKKSFSLWPFPKALHETTES
jgi:pilus assembly protein CpaE